MLDVVVIVELAASEEEPLHGHRVRSQAMTMLLTCAILLNLQAMTMLSTCAVLLNLWLLPEIPIDLQKNPQQLE